MDPLPQLVVLPSVLGGILARLGLYPEMEMVEEAQCFDCVDDSNPAVLDAYQVITILLLAAGCQIRRAGENDRALSIEVRHDELVMDHIGKFSCVAVPLRFERLWSGFSEVCKGKQADTSIRLRDGETTCSLRNTIGEQGALHKRLKLIAHCAFEDVQEYHRIQN
ncbi:hypothetical protein P4131_26520 [Pseudomonas aeruginosa]|nr:hypothetical protein [Pseudomonas aeruginosa]